MKILACLSGKNYMTVSTPIYRKKKMTVMAFVVSFPLFMMTPVTGFAHPKSCELAGNTAEAIMAFNACKADAQAAKLSGYSQEEMQHLLKDEIDQLREENTLLRKQLDDVRSALFQLLQKLSTK